MRNTVAKTKLHIKNQAIDSGSNKLSA